MRKVLLIGAAAVVASLSLGCAMTDYPAISPPVNKSHGIVDCEGSLDRVANTQQVSEPKYLELSYVDGSGQDFGRPFPLTAPVDRQTAREWGRFVGPFSAVAGVALKGTEPEGVWEMGSVKDLSDGSTLITTHHGSLTESGDFPPFSCGFGTASNSGATAGGVLSQMLFPPADVASYMVPQTVAIDGAPSQQWGANLVATSSEVASAGLSTLLAQGTREFEYNLYSTPIARRGEASLGRLLAGSTETFELGDWRISAYGEMSVDGLVIHVTGLVAPNGTVYEAGQTAVRIVIGEIGSRTYQVETTTAESLKLARFARDAGMGDTDFTLPEHVEGIPLPPITFRILAEAIDRKIDQLTALLSGEPGGGFGG